MTARASLEDAAGLLAAVRERAPRVHCLTNSVVQKFTADGLTALGIHPSMTGSEEEVAGFVASADALLVNLGTLDAPRRAAIRLALTAAETAGVPWTLDPVHCDRSPSRLDFASRLLARGPAVVRGNAAEMALMPGPPAGTVAITTGAQDRLALDGRRLTVANGHPLMAQVTGTGCLGGALIAAFMAVSSDRLGGAASALLVYGVAAEMAAETAKGPGTFAIALLDALAAVRPSDLLERGRLVDAER
ncbi:hydroxyethylthiazole kinase [Consotaella aegiceratis]|uniref:hydroxyethylthiazole kinase n=1 Tax=Consotaella aegiceratis TaxID=3097961 RepID=UPI002F3EDCB3